jgi:hypothetical protein
MLRYLTKPVLLQFSSMLFSGIEQPAGPTMLLDLLDFIHKKIIFMHISKRHKGFEFK